MTAPHDLDRQLEAFLATGPTELPDPTFDAVRDRIEHERQRVVIGPWRMPDIMNRLVPIGLGAAAVVGVLAIGVQLFGAPAPGGTGGAPPTPTPSASPSLAVPSSSAPTTTGPTDVAALDMGPMASGDYAFTHVPGVSVVFTVGSGWERNNPVWRIYSVDNDKATMDVLTIDNLYVDPCKPDLGLREPPVGPTVDDLATALRSVPGVTFTAPTPVTQDGASGVRLDYVPPSTLGDCLAGAEVLLAPEPAGPESPTLYAPNGDGSVSVFIYDVDGTRVVVVASYTEARRADLDAVLASIRFE